MDSARRSRLSEEAVRRFAAAVRSAQLYAPGHPLVQRSLEPLGETLTQLLAEQPSLAIGLLDQEIVVGDTPLPRGTEQYGEFVRRLQALGIERVAFERGVTTEALRVLISTIAHPERAIPSAERPGAVLADPLATLQALPHVKVGRINLDERVSTSTADVATIRRGRKYRHRGFPDAAAGGRPHLCAGAFFLSD
jgi:hypothetical protein